MGYGMDFMDIMLRVEYYHVTVFGSEERFRCAA